MVSKCMQVCMLLFQSLRFAGASSKERPVVPDGGTNLSPQQLALLASSSDLQQQVQQATPPTPKEAEETVSALAKPPALSRSNPLLMLSPQKKDGGKQTQLNASPPKQLKINEAISNKPAISGEMPHSEAYARTDTLHRLVFASKARWKLSSTSNYYYVADPPNIDFTRTGRFVKVTSAAATATGTATSLTTSYSFIQQLTAAFSMPNAVPIPAPVKAEQLQ
ncbi:unnamed protein product, partial [Taenia asiatica]|uniref:Uncharacterized protein n=1 Tax=Taenia asiatica TaxID=60517 RepID=A0A0R3WHE1_TAEAS